MTQMYPEPTRVPSDPPPAPDATTSAVLGGLIAVAAIILAACGPARVIACWRWAL